MRGNDFYQVTGCLGMFNSCHYWKGSKIMFLNNSKLSHPLLFIKQLHIIKRNKIVITQHCVEMTKITKY